MRLNFDPVFPVIVSMVALATPDNPLDAVSVLLRGPKLPKVVEDLGRLLPPAMMGLLVVYSLRNTDLLTGRHGLPEAIAVAVTAGLHLWRRNTLLYSGGHLPCTCCWYSWFLCKICAKAPSLRDVVFIFFRFPRTLMVHTTANAMLRGGTLWTSND